MSQRDPPEISFGTGRFQITLRGTEAIRAAGWTLRFVLVARGMVPLLLALCAVYAAAKFGVH